MKRWIRSIYIHRCIDILLSVSKRDLLALNVIDIWSCSLFSTCEIRSNVFHRSSFRLLSILSFVIRSFSFALINSIIIHRCINTTNTTNNKMFFNRFKSHWHAYFRRNEIIDWLVFLLFSSLLSVVLVLPFRMKQKMIIDMYWSYLMWSKMDQPMENSCNWHLKFRSDFSFSSIWCVF